MAQSNNLIPINLQETTVDLALVVALDVSYSVDAAEFRLMREGLALALDTAEVEEALLTRIIHRSRDFSWQR